MNTRDHARVLTLQIGGLGDLVLTSELIGSLKSRHPEWTVVLACRAELEAIAGLFPIPPDEVIGLPLNPYFDRQPSDELRRVLERVVHGFDGFQADILIDGSLRPTWLTWFVAALLQPAVSACCSGVPEPEAMLSTLLDWFGLARRELIDLGPPPEIHERDRYGLLLDYLKIPRVSVFPWRPPPVWESEARGWLDANGLPGGGFIACFPYGTGSVPLKRWPRDRFIRIIDSLQAQDSPVLLFGESAEREQLNAIAQELPRKPAPVFCGDSLRLPLAASVLSKAAAYLGNDTGPAHLAQAYGVGGVAVFGGGVESPRYAPWAAGSIGLVHPLPCSGCYWDCFLGRGLCVESIPAEAVAEAMSSVLKSRQEARMVSVQVLDPAVLSLVEDASARYRVAQRDRARRLEVILELTRASERLQPGAVRPDEQARIGELERVASERLAVLEAVHAEAAKRQTMIEELTAAVREREVRIGALERALAARTRDRAGRK
jgi:ADP-heptose:LPS heptosyltransferase